MNTLNQVFLLNNINFLFIIVIVLMLQFIYLLEKQKTYLYFIGIAILEAILFIHLRKNILTLHYIVTLEIIFILKMLWFILNRKIIKLGKLKKVCLISSYILGILTANANIRMTLIVNIFGNAIIFYNLICKNLKKIHEELNFLEKSNNDFKDYIDNLSKDISVEQKKQKTLNEKEQNLNNVIDTIIYTSNMPVFILNDYNLEYKNKQFDLAFDQTYISNFNFENFFKNNFFYSANIIKSINSKNNLLKLQITSFRDEVYELFVLTLNNNDKNKKVFAFRDITEISNMINEIKFNKKSYKKLVEVLDDGIVIANKNNIYYMNEKIKEIFNITETKENTLVSIEDLSKYVCEPHQGNFIKNIITNKFSKESKVWTTKTKQNKILKVLENPFIIDNTKNLKLIIFTDITTKQNLLEDIAQSEKIYRVLLESLPDGIILIDKRTRKYIYKNKYTIEMLKKIGKEKLKNIVDEYISSEEFEKIKKIPLNSKETISISISDIGTEKIYIGILKLNQQNDKNAQDEYNLQKIKKNEEFKTKLYMEIVSKIENPVNVMISQNKLMAKDTNSYVMESHVDLVKQNLYRLKKILNNINDIVDIENHSYKLEYTIFDLSKLLKDIVYISKEYTDKASLDIELEMSDEKVLVYLDCLNLQKIILNILSNAIKFTPKNGKIKIVLDKKIDFIVVRIKDNGIGIPKDKIDFIFENFNQVDKSLSRVAEGMGMGLYLAKKLADIQGIYLNTESKINKGSEFNILIKNEKNSFSNDKYKKDFSIEKEFIDIQYSDIYLN